MTLKHLLSLSCVALTLATGPVSHADSLTTGTTTLPFQLTCGGALYENSPSPTYKVDNSNTASVDCESDDYYSVRNITSFSYTAHVGTSAGVQLINLNADPGMQNVLYHYTNFVSYDIPLAAGASKTLPPMSDNQAVSLGIGSYTAYALASIEEIKKGYGISGQVYSQAVMVTL